MLHHIKVLSATDRLAENIISYETSCGIIGGKTIGEDIARGLENVTCEKCRAAVLDFWPQLRKCPPWAVHPKGPILVGNRFERNSTRVKVVGFKGKTTVMVVTDHYPISSRPESARGLRIRTLLREWTRVDFEPVVECRVDDIRALPPKSSIP